MCFKRKKKKEINSKYKIGQRVSFRHERTNDLIIGYVYEIREDNEGHIKYAVQVGGECPYIKRDLDESRLIG